MKRFVILVVVLAVSVLAVASTASAADTYPQFHWLEEVRS
jgi:hypothetical protein